MPFEGSQSCPGRVGTRIVRTEVDVYYVPPMVRRAEIHVALDWGGGVGGKRPMPRN